MSRNHPRDDYWRKESDQELVQRRGRNDNREYGGSRREDRPYPQSYEPDYGERFESGRRMPERGRPNDAQRSEDYDIAHRMAHWSRDDYGRQYAEGFYGGDFAGQPTGGESRLRGAGGQNPHQRGPHYGRGPRGYRRSDERLQEEINDRLTEHGELDATDIEVRVMDGEVTLTGTVMDRQSKRLAEDLAEGVMGVSQVHNQIRIQPASVQSGPHQQHNGNR